MFEVLFIYFNFVFYIFIVFLSIFVYFIPTIIAHRKNHKDTKLIFIINLLSGYTIIGWIISFIWAFSSFKIKKILKTPTIAEEIEQLSELVDKGIITEKEFQKKKSQLLNSNNNFEDDE